MGPVYLFAENLSEALLRSVRQLGPGYAFCFQPPNVDSRDLALLASRDPHLRALSQLDAGGHAGSTSDLGGLSGRGERRRMERAAGAATTRHDSHLAALTGVLTPLIILAYNPSVWAGEYFLDSTPECNPVKWTNSSSQESSSSTQTGDCATPVCDETARGRVMYSIAGSHSVYIQAHRTSRNHRWEDCRGSGPAPVNIRTAQADARARTRGWSGWSGLSGLSGGDDVFGETGGRSARSVRPRPRPGYMHAMRLPGTRECVTRDVRDALDCLGGVKVLLPLFAQYDHGVQLGEGLGVSYKTDLRLNETVLALLAGTLRDRCVCVCEYLWL